MPLMAINKHATELLALNEIGLSHLSDRSLAIKLSHVHRLTGCQARAGIPAVIVYTETVGAGC